MSSLVQNLHQDEEIKCFFKKHPLFLFKHFLFYTSVVVILIALYVALTIGNTSFFTTSTQKFAFFLSVFLFVQIFIHLFFLKLIYFQFDIIVITTRGIIHLKKTLLLVSSVKKFELEKVNEIHVEQMGLLQNILNYGRIIITMSVGEQNIVYLDFIPNPAQYQRMINNEIRELETRIYHEDEYLKKHVHSSSKEQKERDQSQHAHGVVSQTHSKMAKVFKKGSK